MAATINPLVAAAPEAKEAVLRECLEDAAEKMAAIIHSYFPKLLAIATKHRPTWRRKHVSPASWTTLQFREQVYTFLGMDANANFKDVATPREDSRVLQATHLILYCAGYLPKSSTDRFCLPWWADRRHVNGYVWGPVIGRDFLGHHIEDYSFSPPSGDDSECMSEDDSLAWVREREHEIRARLESRLDNEMLGVFASGASGGELSEAPATLDALKRRRVSAASHDFDKTVGKWMYEAHSRLKQEATKAGRGRKTPNLPTWRYKAIVERTDRARIKGKPRFPLKDVLSGKGWKLIADYNTRAGGAKKKLSQWSDVAFHREFKRAVRYRYNRAEIYYRTRVVSQQP